MASISPTRGNALVVEDDPGLRMCIADVLADMGYAVVEAGHADEALRAVDGGLAPALLVTDHLMPGMSGSVLAREVVARHPQARVILVSGYSDLSADPGMILLAKPFRLQELRDCVEAAAAPR
ncbi:MAG: response regulator [Pseudoxanthomonas sp.]|nr:response regulator [Pseudoxanthomonas sp.]